VTDTPSDWVEQASYSPNGQKITFMSSECCNWDPDNWRSLAAEIFLMDANGGRRVQLTHFNTPGYPESREGRSIATWSVWSPDGTQLIVEQIFVPENYLTKRPTRLWKLTFQGKCGA
jgi:Tol biopolymer transport system component